MLERSTGQWPGAEFIGKEKTAAAVRSDAMNVLRNRLAVGMAMLMAAIYSQGAESMTVVASRRIWSEAPHNAFTDLHRQHHRWYCVFREGAAHVSPDGAARVLASEDGEKWEPLARITVPWADLRDPKLTETPDGRMLLTAGALLHEAKAGCTNKSLAWVSRDGKEWDGPYEIGEPNIWMWSCERHGDSLYSVGYFKVWPSKKHADSKAPAVQSPGKHLIRLYRSNDGLKWAPITTQTYEGRYINETAITFRQDGQMIALTRRENGPEPRVSRMGSSRPPFIEWKWHESDHRLNGPAICALPDGRIVAGGRWKIAGREHTRIGWLDAESATLTPALILPSQPETGYPSIVHHDGRLFVSYYGSQDGKPSIYFAVVQLAPPQ